MKSIPDIVRTAIKDAPIVVDGRTTSAGAALSDYVVCALTGAVVTALRAETRGGAPELTRRAVGVVSDVFKLREEAAKVLDLYAVTTWTPLAPPDAPTVDVLIAELAEWRQRAARFLRENAAANAKQGLPVWGPARTKLLEHVADVQGDIIGAGK